MSVNFSGVQSVRFARALLLTALVALAALLAGRPGAGPASAAFPGRNGRIAFTGYGDGDGEIYVIRPTGGAPTQLTDNTVLDIEPAWSPDGRRIAFRSERDGNSEIYVMNADGSAPTRLTTDPAVDYKPAWSPDGTRIVFVSERSGNTDLFIINADGTGQPQNITNSAAYENAPAWSPDGSRIAFSRDPLTPYRDIWVLDLTTGMEKNLTGDNDRSDNQPNWSPDGSRIAYVTFNIHGDDIFVMNADGSNQTQLTEDPTNDWWPAWSPDGSRIAFSASRTGVPAVFTMNADGSEETKLTGVGYNYLPDWQPLLDDDADGDGVTADVEDGAPNGGDGNNDGVPDSEQPHVASLPNSADGAYLTLATSAGRQLGDVAAIDNPSPGNAPAEALFPAGFLSFSITNLNPGQTAHVDVLPANNAGLETYYKYGPTPGNPVPHWYEFVMDGSTGAVSIASGWRLNIIDGGRGDSDLTADGVIVDPGGPAAKADVEVTGLEVTQSVQDLRNSVVLVAGRPTFVRAHARTTGGQPLEYVEATLAVRDAAGNPLPGSPLKSVNAGVYPCNDHVIGQALCLDTTGMITLNPNPDRHQLNDSFLFRLPDAWLTGTVELELAGLELGLGSGSDPAFICSEPDGDANAANDGDCRVRVSFTDSPVLQINLVSVVWKIRYGGQDYLYRPTRALLEQIKKEFQARFPTRTIDFTEDEFKWAEDGRPDSTDLENILYDLRAKRAMDGCAGNTCDRYYVGILAHADVGAVSLYEGFSRVPYDVAVGWADEGTVYDDNVLPHELGHATGRQHVRCDGTEGYPDLSYPYPEGAISPGPSGPTALFGFHPFSLKIFGPATKETMSYCGPDWFSDYTYKAIRLHLVERHATRRAAAGAAAGETGVVSLRLAADGGHGQIISLYRFEAAPSPDPGGGDFALELFNAGGAALSTHRFTPPAPAEGDDTGLVLEIPWPAGVARIDLTYKGTVLDSRAASPHPPTVTLLSPNGGESLSGPTVVVEWQATDADGDPLGYVVQYSPDNGATWGTLSINWPTTRLEFNRPALDGSDDGLFRVLATDGFHTAQDASDGTAALANNAPQVTIAEPGGPTVYAADGSIRLAGSAYDLEDGALSGAALVWSSEVAGELGVGAELTLGADALTPGTHTITLTATDIDGDSASATVAISIRAELPPAPPSIVVAPVALDFVITEDETASLSAALSVRNGGEGDLNWSATTNRDWIALSAVGGTAPGEIVVTLDTADLGVGEHTGAIAIASPQTTGGPHSVPVRVLVLRDGWALFLPVALRP